MSVLESSDVQILLYEEQFLRKKIVTTCCVVISHSPANAQDQTSHFRVIYRKDSFPMAKHEDQDGR